MLRKVEILEDDIGEKMKCPNCGEELESWVTKEELPKVKSACKTWKEWFK